MPCTEGHSKGFSGYTKYTVESKKEISPHWERSRSTAGTQRAVSHEHELSIFFCSTIWGCFSSWIFWGTKHLISHRKQGALLLSTSLERTPATTAERAWGHQLHEPAHPRSCSVTSYETPAPLPRQAPYKNNKPQKYRAPSSFSIGGTIAHGSFDEAERVSQTCPEAPRMLPKRGCRRGAGLRALSTAVRSSSTQRERRGIPALKLGLGLRFVNLI